MREAFFARPCLGVGLYACGEAGWLAAGWQSVAVLLLSCPAWACICRDVRRLARRRTPGFVQQFWWCLSRAILKRVREPLTVFTDYAIVALTGTRCQRATAAGAAGNTASSRELDSLIPECEEES